VLGSGAEVRHAVELAELDPSTVGETLESLVRAQILRDEPGLSFVHALVRAAVYADMPVAARARAHARAADILARAGADVDAVAAHLLESPSGGDAAVVEQLRSAARRAVDHGATDVAAAYLRRALREQSAPAHGPALLRESGAAELAAGLPDAA